MMVTTSSILQENMKGVFVKIRSNFGVGLDF